MGRDVGEELTGILAGKTKDLVEEKKCEEKSLNETVAGLMKIRMSCSNLV